MSSAYLFSERKGRKFSEKATKPCAIKEQCHGSKGSLTKNMTRF